jgi:hypothetical protein
VARQSLEERLATPVEPIDPTQVAVLTDRVQVTPGLMAALGPVIGMLLRTRREMVTA